MGAACQAWFEQENMVRACLSARAHGRLKIWEALRLDVGVATAIRGGNIPLKNNTWPKPENRCFNRVPTGKSVRLPGKKKVTCF